MESFIEVKNVIKSVFQVLFRIYIIVVIIFISTKHMFNVYCRNKSFSIHSGNEGGRYNG